MVYTIGIYEHGECEYYRVQAANEEEAEKKAVEMHEQCSAMKEFLNL